MAREPSPVDMMARPLVEPAVHPLFDAEVWSANTLEAMFFKVAVGGPTTAGAFNIKKTYRHCNLETPGMLSRPRLFLVHGIRICLNNAPQTTSSDTKFVDSSLCSYGHPQQALQRFIQYRCYFDFQIGIKPYARGPCFLFPANLALVPQVASACVGARYANGVDLGAVSDGLYTQSWGLYYATGRNAVTIPPGQVFWAQIKAANGTLNAVQSSAFPYGQNDGIHRLLYVILDGVHAREVM